VCRRSSTSCSTCRHFRLSVAAKVGYCGLDRDRQPLEGTEIRSCWEEGRVAVAADDPADDVPIVDVSRRPLEGSLGL
jgi:hypothetical protein